MKLILYICLMLLATLAPITVATFGENVTLATWLLAGLLLAGALIGASQRRELGLPLMLACAILACLPLGLFVLS